MFIIPGSLLANAGFISWLQWWAFETCKDGVQGPKIFSIWWKYKQIYFNLCLEGPICSASVKKLRVHPVPVYPLLKNYIVIFPWRALASLNPDGELWSGRTKSIHFRSKETHAIWQLWLLRVGQFQYLNFHERVKRAEERGLMGYVCGFEQNQKVRQGQNIDVFFIHNFCIKPYVPWKPRRDPCNRWLYE